MPILRASLATRIVVSVEAGTKYLTIKVIDASIRDISYEAVGNFYVNDQKLANYRAAKILSKIVGTNTFGTGFPIVHR